MRDAGKRWENFSHIQAACGVKIVAPNLEKAIAGTTLHLANTAEQRDNAEQMIREEWRGIHDKMPIMCSVCKKVSPRVEFIANCQNGTCSCG